jgi:hypothetical protein
VWLSFFFPFTSSQISPDINHMLHLSVFPNDEFRETTVFLVCMSIVGTFIWDRIVLLIFGAPSPALQKMTIHAPCTHARVQLLPCPLYRL